MVDTNHAKSEVPSMRPKVGRRGEVWSELPAAPELTETGGLPSEA